jgi:hypothetical protein
MSRDRWELCRETRHFCLRYTFPWRGCVPGPGSPFEEVPQGENPAVEGGVYTGRGDRAGRGVSGALYSQSALAGPIVRPRTERFGTAPDAG